MFICSLNDEDVGKMTNRMAGKRFTGFQNPVNPVKTEFTAPGPLNACGC
jgi:hypothetical protein